jgi:hypothetical protein
MLLLVSSSVHSAANRARDRQTNERPFRLIEATIDDVHAALTSGQISCLTLVDFSMRKFNWFRRGSRRVPIGSAFTTIDGIVRPPMRST